MDAAQDEPKNYSQLTREERRAHWQQQIDLALESGLPISRYCREHGISLPSFNYWRQALKEKSPEFKSEKGKFVRLEVSDAEESSKGIRLELGHGIQLRFDREPSAAWICEVAKSMRGTQS